MGIFDRFKSTAGSRTRPDAPAVLDATPAVQPTRLPTAELIPAVDVFRGAVEADPADPKHVARLPKALVALGGPLGTEMPHRIMTEGFRGQMKNVRAGVDLELTLRMNPSVSIYPQIHVFRDDNCMGLLEIHRAEWYAPVTRLAEKHGVAMTMSGITAHDGLRVEPYIFLPGPQELYDHVRSALLTKLAAAQ